MNWMSNGKVHSHGFLLSSKKRPSDRPFDLRSKNPNAMKIIWKLIAHIDASIEDPIRCLCSTEHLAGARPYKSPQDLQTNNAQDRGISGGLQCLPMPFDSIFYRQRRWSLRRSTVNPWYICLHQDNARLQPVRRCLRFSSKFFIAAIPLLSP